MKSKKVAHFVTSGMLASTIIFSFGTGSAFANGDGTETTTETGTVTEPVENTTVDTGATTEDNATEDTTSEAVETETTTEDSSATTEEESTEQSDEATTEDTEVADEEEAPSLIPGDFFYFVKLMAEKVRLAFTFDDYKEAQLLANFAAERIAEANALFTEGKTDEAAELLKEAIATQEQANNKVSEEATTGEDTVSDTEGEVSDQAEATDETEATDDTEVKVKSKLAHNIDALLMALEHVENPKAQQSLMKNIQKSFAKLEKKAAKLEKKDAKFAKKMKKLEDQVNGDESSDDEVATDESTTEETSTEVEQETTEAITPTTEQETEKQEEAKKILDDFNKKIEVSKDKLKKAGVMDKSFTLVENNSGKVWVFGNKWGRGGEVFYDYLDLKAPDVIEKDIIDGDQYIELSLEALPEYCGDYIIKSVWAKEDNLKDNGLWNNIKAVKEGRVITTSAELYYYMDIYSMNAQLDIFVDDILKLTNK